MVNCKGCPFLYSISNVGFEKALTKHHCKLGYAVNSEASTNCQIQIIQISFKNKPDSITFRPEELQNKTT
jgi:hypothetical protein